MNSNIQIIDTLSDDPADCSPNSDELVDTVLVTVMVVMAVDVTVVVVVSVTAQVPVRVKCSIR